MNALRPLAAAMMLSISLAACAAEEGAEEESTSANAISGAIEEGSIVTVVGDGLRLRKTPSRKDSKNVIGLLPKGTKVKILLGTPTDGFYKVDVVDEPIRSALALSAGWVYGDHLVGRSAEPDDEESTTGTHDEPTVVTVDFVVSDCATMKDDKGKAMAPTVDDFLTKDEIEYAVLAIDTNTFSYGMRASIAEIDQPSSFNPGGRKVPFKIVKTAKTQPEGAFTVTVCANPLSKLVLPTTDGKLTLSVYPD